MLSTVNVDFTKVKGKIKAMHAEKNDPSQQNEEPPVLWSENWSPCPRCDGYIGKDGVCNRCGLDTKLKPWWDKS